MAKRIKYSPEFKAEAAEFYKTHGPAAAKKKYTKIAPSTLYYWAYPEMIGVVRGRKKDPVKEEGKEPAYQPPVAEEKKKKEPVYRPIVMEEKKKPNSKKIFVVYSEDPEALVATLKGLL